MSVSKRHPQREKKRGEVCMCTEDTPKESKEKQLIKTYKQPYLFYRAEPLIRFRPIYLKVPDARIVVRFKVLCARDCAFCRDASCQAEIIDF